jgi:cytochrome P450
MTSSHAASGCPVLQGFDPLDPDQVGEPFGLLAQARREMPVFYIPKLDLWCVSRMEEVLTVFRDTETFSNSHEEVGRPPDEFIEQIPEGHPVSHSLDTMDPPAHTRIRKLAQKAFTPRHVGQREDEIRALCNDLIDEFADTGSADLVSEFTTHIPVRVIAKVVGLDLELAPVMKQARG